MVMLLGMTCSVFAAENEQAHPKFVGLVNRIYNNDQLVSVNDSNGLDVTIEFKTRYASLYANGAYESILSDYLTRNYNIRIGKPSIISQNDKMRISMSTVWQSEDHYTCMINSMSGTCTLELLWSVKLPVRWYEGTGQIEQIGKLMLVHDSVDLQIDSFDATYGISSISNKRFYVRNPHFTSSACSVDSYNQWWCVAYEPVTWYQSWDINPSGI